MTEINDYLFKVNFDELMVNLKRYYLAEYNNQNVASKAVFFEGEKGTISLLMAINRLCSTKKGTQFFSRTL
jgi:hypothetical protein